MVSVFLFPSLLLPFFSFFYRASVLHWKFRRTPFSNANLLASALADVAILIHAFSISLWMDLFSPQEMLASTAHLCEPLFNDLPATV